MKKEVLCDPFDLKPMDRGELEKLALFAVCVAGKNARTTWPKVVRFHQLMEEREPCGEVMSPFELLSMYDHMHIDEMLREVKMGQYARITKALYSLGHLTYSWTWRDLLKISGINLKTAKLVELYRHPGQNCACLDVHVLRAMAEWPGVKRLKIEVPTSSPQDEVIYCTLEGIVLAEAARLGFKPWEFDKSMWLTAQVDAAA